MKTKELKKQKRHSLFEGIIDTSDMDGSDNSKLVEEAFGENGITLAQSKEFDDLLYRIYSRFLFTLEQANWLSNELDSFIKAKDEAHRKELEEAMVNTAKKIGYAYGGGDPLEECEEEIAELKQKYLKE